MFAKRFYTQRAIHLTLRDFHKKIEVGIYIQKTSHFALRDVLILKKLDTSQKARQFAIRFYTKTRHFCVTRFFIEFLKFAEGGGHLFIKKTMYFA